MAQAAPFVPPCRKHHAVKNLQSHLIVEKSSLSQAANGAVNHGGDLGIDTPMSMMNHPSALEVVRRAGHQGITSLAALASVDKPIRFGAVLNQPNPIMQSTVALRAEGVPWVHASSVTVRPRCNTATKSGHILARQVLARVLALAPVLLELGTMTRPADNTPTRALAYLRVSTDKQAEEGVSLDAQRAKVELYAELYGLDLAGVYVDAGASAKSLDRPELQRALAALTAGKADALVVVKLDRLTRSVADLGALVEQSTREGWALLSVSEQLDTRSAAGRLVLNILASVSQWEREAIGERTSAALSHKAAQGEYTGGQVPYGWALDADGVNLVPHAGEQLVILAAQELRAQGYSLRKVADALAERGLSPRSGGRWYATSVKRLLSAKVADA